MTSDQPPFLQKTDLETESRDLQSQKMAALGQLTGGIAHDFNNLLTVVLGNLELISSRTDDNKIARLAQNAAEAARRGTRLTSQLLAFSRHQKLAPVQIDINHTIRDMEDLLRRSLGPQVEIETRFEASPASVVVDSTQFELAILNLAINARDAMDAGGRLIITTRTDLDGSCVAIAVSDTGNGMPPEVSQHAFEPFFTTKEAGKGTGLGLSQVYTMAKHSAGDVLIDSRIGNGTTVTIRLPLIDAISVDDKTSVAPLLAARRGHRETILVIEDDETVRLILVEAVSSLGYLVFEAADGRSGLSLMDSVQPDLVVTDYAMPGMSGLEVAYAIADTHMNVPVIISTGYSEIDGAKDRLEDYPNVLYKPFEIAELSQSIRSLLASRQLQTEMLFQNLA